MPLRFLVLLSFLVANSAFAQDYTASPKQLSLSTSYTVTVSQSGCKEPNGNLKVVKATPGEGGTPATGGTAPDLATSTTGLTLTPLVDSTGTSALTCQTAWKIDVSSTAPLGATDLILKDNKGGNFLGFVHVEVIPLAPGPIPPGLTAQVDVKWDVLPYVSVADSFGRRVASEYFAVRVTIGNNSGYPIQITDIGFRTPGTTDSNSLPPIPNDPYFITRGTIEKEQQVGPRAIILNSINAIAGIMTGATGFVRLAGNAANYSLGVGLMSPLNAGFALVYPDTTVRHLLGLDTRAFRDAAVVPNNSPSPPIVTFVGRELVECNFVAEDKRPTTAPSADKSTKDCGGSFHGITRVLRNRTNFNPNEIADALGTLVIVGQPINYLPRIQISGTTVTATAPPAAPAPSVAPAIPPQVTAPAPALAFTAGQKKSGIMLAGKGFTGVKKIAAPDGGGTTANLKVVSDVSLTFDYDGADAKAGSYSFTVDNGTSPAASVPFTVNPSAASAPQVTAPAPPLAFTVGQKKSGIALAGKGFTGVRTIAAPDGGGTTANLKVVSDVSLTFDYDGTNAKAGSYSFTIDNGTAPPASVPFTVK
jgi:hypothetical protein